MWQMTFLDSTIIIIKKKIVILVVVGGGGGLACNLERGEGELLEGTELGGEELLYTGNLTHLLNFLKERAGNSFVSGSVL